VTTQAPDFRRKIFNVDSTVGSTVDYRDSGYTNADETLDLYWPTTTVAGSIPCTSDPLPLILYVHGGSFTSGTKANAECGEFANRFAARGFLVAPIDYKMLGSYSYQASEILATKSVRAAIRWANAFDVGSLGCPNAIDTSRIVIAGDSAGGTACVFATIADFEDTDGFTTYNGTRPAATVAFWPATQSCGFGLTTGTIGTNITNGLADNILSVHGKNDVTNTLAETQALAYATATLSGLGRMRYHVLDNAGHTAWTGGAAVQGVYDDAEDLVAFFLRERLGL